LKRIINKGEVMKTIKLNVKCPECKGTGLYTGMGEREGSAVLCSNCEATGCLKYEYKYEDFISRENPPINIKRVYKVNPGICIGEGNGHKLEDFGGMPIKEWLAGLPFPKNSEDRTHTCPAWYYQCADYKLKPHWNECILCGAFSDCKNFVHKETCWNKFDKENK
jgi:hypothetical protein